ncbi:hypothetical protein JQ633_06015 [Bradyrhizobium tropiciagri]|nr:hypothetical protein [Bradyrhizobium tropiciagri]
MRWLVVATLVVFGSLVADRPASAAGALIAASANANAGLSACSTSRGKELYNCVADVLDRLNNEIAPIRVPEAQRALQTASARLRAANSKAEALSAISQAQAAIAGAIRQAKAAPGATQDTGRGLSAIVGVLARAAKLIQAKG